MLVLFVVVACVLTVLESVRSNDRTFDKEESKDAPRTPSGE